MGIEPMIAYAIRRLLYSIPVLLVLSIDEAVDIPCIHLLERFLA